MLRFCLGYFGLCFDPFKSTLLRYRSFKRNKLSLLSQQGRRPYIIFRQGLKDNVITINYRKVLRDPVPLENSTVQRERRFIKFPHAKRGNSMECVSHANMRPYISKLYVCDPGCARIEPNKLGKYLVGWIKERRVSFQQKVERMISILIFIYTFICSGLN